MKGMATKTAKKSRVPLPFQTPGEEIANSILHGVGSLIAMAALVLLVIRGNGFLGGRGPDIWGIVAYTVYGSTMIIMFMASTLYHALTAEGAKRVFRVLDHSAIYLLIAGTYTPFCLVSLRGPWGWTLFGIEWGLAILGIVLHAVGAQALKKVEVGVYIAMGWAIVVGWSPLVKALSRASLFWLILGGVLYTLGTVWYIQKIRRGTHVTWHAFVLAGAVAHFWAIWCIS